MQSKTAPRTPQKLQLRHKQKSGYTRAHVAHFTAAFYTLVQELALPAQSLGFPNP